VATRANADDNFNAKAQRRKAFHILPSPPEEVWARKAVRFEIRRGAFEPKYGIIAMMTGIGSSDLSGLGPNQANSGPLSKKRASQALLVPIYPG